ncbi:MAG: Activator of Hsp90 ATPase 1 family protein [Acidimicrobiaceae bacterium]|nr:Activator of Hsp90 ATPase 1 family protein [Acidimicrobiaceae bacterium]
MSVTSVKRDPAALTLTIEAQYAAPIERVWALWEDPRLLEQWWGPPTYPATMVDHDLTPGGRVRYYMTGPEGDKARGWWRVLEVNSPRYLSFEDGFADDTGEPMADMPFIIIRVTLSETAAQGTRMVIEGTFPSTETLERYLSMGMEEGITAAVSQIDALL